MTKNKNLDTMIDLDGNSVYRNPRYINEDNPWAMWGGMPHYEAKGFEHYAEIEIEIDESDIQGFSELITQPFTDKTKSIWHPKLQIDSYKKIRYTCDNSHYPKYPIYIVSKSRFEKRPTSDSLIRQGVKHYMVVEESQLADYQKHVDPEFVTLITIPQKYFDEYETCDDLGTTRSKGPGPARNFAWQHSIDNGHKRHWVMDDNQDHFFRMDGNKRTPVLSAACWAAMEDHTDRYTNVVMSGPNYRFFVIPGNERPPFLHNTRIYSCNLIRNDIEFRWRGRYNEDTILSLDILKVGLCTIQYNTFLTGKMVTQAMAGGNTEEFYSKEGTKPKSQMLVDVHPDVAELKWMHNRWHHYVNYAPYRRTRLIYRDDYIDNQEPYEYGMTLTQLDGIETYEPEPDQDQD